MDILDRLNCGSPSIPAMRDGAEEIMQLRAKVTGLRESMRLDAQTMEAKDRRIAELENSFSDGAKWIPVTERLPAFEDDRQFIAVNSAGYCACVTALYRTAKGSYNGEDATPEETADRIGDVTYWMPLLETPK